VTSDTGVYQSQAQLLDLFGNVTVIHENGTRLITKTARVDVGHNAAEGNDPVEGHGPSGDIKSQGFRIYDKGDDVLFTGKSDLMLNGAKVSGANAPRPPAVPSSVAATAGRIEAQERMTSAAVLSSGSGQQRAREQGTHAKSEGKPRSPSAALAGISPG